MRRVLVGLFALSGLVVPLVGATAGPAAAICFTADGEEKAPPQAYDGEGDFSTTGVNQTAVVSPNEGDTVKWKAKFKNVTDEKDKVLVTADDTGGPNVRVRYFGAGTEITNAMEGSGKTFKDIESDEFTKTITVEVKVKNGATGSARNVNLDGRVKNAPCGNVDRVGVQVDLT